MWESRVLGEISKSLWEPFYGFHRDGISTALFTRSPAPPERSPEGILQASEVADRRSWGLLAGHLFGRIAAGGEAAHRGR
jgi:hypothetical protein